MPVRDKYVESYKEKTSIKPNELIIEVKRDSLLYWSQVYNDTISQVKIVESLNVFKLKQELLNSDLQEYTVVERTTRLDNLAFQIYGTPYLWWIVKLLNPDIFVTPFSFAESGATIRVAPFNRVMEVLRELQ